MLKPITIYLTLLLLTLNLSTTAQKVKVTWGEESKTETEFNSFVRGDGNDLIKLGFEGRRKSITPVITIYDNNLGEKVNREFEFDEDNTYFNNIFSIKNKLFLFTKHYDKESKSTTFYSQQLNINTLAPVGKNQSLGDFQAVKKSSQTSIGYELSKDSSKVVMFGMSPYSKKDNEKYYIAVYSDNIQKLWENTIELPYLDKFIAILDYMVTNDGEVGVIIKHYDQEVTSERIKKNGNKYPSYKTKMLLYSKDNKTPKEFELDVKDKFVNNLSLASDANNNLMLFGLYKNNYNGYINGYFLTVIDRINKKVTLKKMEQFPEELVTQVDIDKQGSDNEKDPGFSNWFRLARIVERENGVIDYLLEYSSEVFVNVPSTYNGTSWSRSYSYWSYNYGDIIDISIRPDNSSMFSRIPKTQQSKDIRLFSNFVALPYKDKLLVFYNDDPDNLERDIRKKPDDIAKFTNSVLAMVTVNSDGSIERKAIFDHKKMNLTTAVRECRIFSNKKVGLYAQRLGKVFTSAKDMVGILEVE
jgi:hypothetical protein